MHAAYAPHPLVPRIRARAAWGRVSPVVAFGCWLLSSAGGTEAQPAGTPFRVNTITTGYQEYPAIASAADGSFVVVWQNRIGRAGSLNGRRFYRDGTPAGEEFRVDSVTGIGAGRAAIASDSAGNFFVAFTDYRYSGGIHRDDVYVRRFARSGEPLGPELRVNTYTSEAQNQPSIAADEHGRFVVAWKRFDHYGEGGLFGQRFSETGAPAGEEFAIKIFTPTQISAPSIACNAEGNFVIVWDWVVLSQAPSTYDVDVAVRRYDSSGTPLGPEFRANTYTTGTQGDSAVASDATGNFTIVWADHSPSRPGNDIVVRRFSSGGEPLDPGFRVNTEIEPNNVPAISSNALGDFVITWWDSDSYFAIRVRPFARTGEPRGSEMKIYQTQTPWPVVASDLNGDFVVAYESTGYTEPSNRMEVFGQRYVGGVHGDVDGDGLLEVGDVLALINYLFAAGPPPLGPADANSDGAINVTDILFLINSLFAGGPPPP